MRKWIGSLVGAVFFILSLADVPDQLRRWQDWVFGMSDGQLAFLAGDAGRWLLAVLGVLLALWANNVHGRLYSALRTSHAKKDPARAADTTTIHPVVPKYTSEERQDPARRVLP